MPTTFAVAIPTHNRRETAVLSTLSALRQARAPEQVIVLCDGCTDGTAAAIRELGDARATALELPKEPGYAYEHRNRALELTRADVVLWLGDDDLLLPDHLERLGELWDLGTVDVATSPAVIVEPDDTLAWFGTDWSVPWHRAWLERGNSNVMASVSVRAQLVRDAGGWDPAQPRRGDWDLWKRVLATGARAADTGEPTVLHFRATERDQAWPDRVIQNARWLERISDPDALCEVRRALRRARSERDARLMARLEQIELERDGIVNGRWWRLRERLLPVRRAIRGY
jgi:glycosyltransferase involved in cell wall biosynthesis